MAKKVQPELNSDNRLYIAYDDGAGFTKWIVKYGEKTIRFKIMSLVAPASGEGAMGYGLDTAQIQIPTTEDLFASRIIYTTGEHLADRTDVLPDTSELRYNQRPFALVRFYAGLGRAITEFGINATKDNPVSVSLVAGMSTSLYEKMSEGGTKVTPVQKMFEGDHYFSYKGTIMRADVDRVLMGPQAHFATLAVLANPNDKLRRALEEFEDLDFFTFDIGNHTVDCGKVKDIDGIFRPTKYFAINKGVDEVRQRVARFAMATLFQPITQKDIDAAITPGKYYGTLPDVIGGRKRIDAKDVIDEIINSVWASIWTDMSMAMRGSIAQHCIIGTGGGSIIFQKAINATMVEATHRITFAEHDAAILTLSEWSVVEGMVEAAQQEVAKN